LDYKKDNGKDSIEMLKENQKLMPGKIQRIPIFELIIKYQLYKRNSANGKITDIPGIKTKNRW